MSQNMSMRAYARYRGISDGAVRKAIHSGRITANEVLKAQTNKVRLARLKGDLVDRSQAVAHVYKLARTQRDAWLNWPARVSAQLASDLNVDAHQMHQVLEKAVREHLLDLGDMAVRID